MKLRNLLLYITAFTLAVVNSSCKDDDDETAPDPRIRRFVISQLGTNVEFIVNDVEGKIYNYDSLAYGTRVDSLYPSIYSYSSTDILSLEYSSNGKDFKELRNTIYLDFTKPLTFISTNTKDNSTKKYTVEVRVHKYDVDAFQWTNTGEISEMKDSVLSQKSVVYNDLMWQFFQTKKECKVVTSEDGEVWKSKKIDAPEALKLSTLCHIDDSLFVQGVSGAYYAANFTDLQFSKFDAITSGQLLYTLNNQIWIIDGGDIKSFSKSGEAKISQSLPETFVVDTISTFTAPSGYTTLGYLYAKKGDNAEIWAADRYGNVECLTNGSEGIPYMDKTIAFNFGHTLGILGGISVDGEFTTECYTSENSGLTWTIDEHKDLSNSVGALADAGIFQTSHNGEFLLIGGRTAKGQNDKIWTLRLKQLLLEEDFINKLK